MLPPQTSRKIISYAVGGIYNYYFATVLTNKKQSLIASSMDFYSSVNIPN